MTLLVAVCLAEVASRFDRTGGTYVYVRAAFGGFVGFEVGWMQWFTRASSQASVVSGITMTLAYYAAALGWRGARHRRRRADALPTMAPREFCRAALTGSFTAVTSVTSVTSVSPPRYLPFIAHRRGAL